MSDTSTPKQLLVVALQDLLDAEKAWMERADELGGKAPEPVATYLRGEAERSAGQAARLETLLAELGADKGMPNIWLRSILDDAARDADTIVAGPLRGIAMVGAFRKAKQSERVSYETAIGLADALGQPYTGETLKQSRAEEMETDVELARLLCAQLQAIS